tara:strand:- start:10112 stop:10273 length:162 start_codon:yes stop_codon:yes gene_type:complete
MYLNMDAADDRYIDRAVIINMIGANAVSIILTSLIIIEIIHNERIIILVINAV